jgi:DnaJ like chaperone protein
MDIVTIIVVVIAGIFIYAVVTMFRSSAGAGREDGGQRTQDEGRKTKDEGRQTADGSGREFQGGAQKKRYGKWVGGGLGFAFGGPIGALIGIALGSFFDGMSGTREIYRGTPRGDFAMSLLVLSAAVMKADQKVVRAELDFVRSFFLRQFGEQEGTRLMLMLREILKQDINIPEVSRQVGQYMDYSSRLQLLHYLFGIASSDGSYHPDEVAVIEQISGYMGISSSDFLSVKAMFVKNPAWAYDVLEITKDATNDEVKKAYRELAKKHHPDKLGHLGEDIRRSATEKFQKINAAYEEVKKQRGMN